jgi:3-oxoadipate enol-lactonase
VGTIFYEQFPVHYVREGKGPALVFIHGLGGNNQSWESQTRYFREQYTCICIDNLGHGKSIPDPFVPEMASIITLEHMAKAVLAVLSEEKIDSAVFCGLSMGGLIAQEIIRLQPQRVKALILADTFAVIPAAAPSPERAKRLELLHAGKMDEVARLVSEISMHEQCPQELKEKVYEVVRRNNPMAYKKASHEVFTANLTEGLSRIQVPTLVLIGDEDTRTPLPLSEFLVEQIQGAKLVIIPKAGHLSNAERPDAFNTSLDQFLSSLLQTADADPMNGFVKQALALSGIDVVDQDIPVILGTIGGLNQAMAAISQVPLQNVVPLLTYHPGGAKK